MQTPGVGNTSISYVGNSYNVAGVQYPSPTGMGMESASYQYDALGNVTQVTSPGPNGNPVTRTFSYTGTAPDGSTYTAKIGQPRAITDGTGAVVARMDYDNQGNLVLAKDGANRTVTTEYNEANQPVQVNYPTPATSSNLYPDHVTIDYLYPSGPATRTKLFDNANNVVREYGTRLGKEGEILGPANTPNTKEPFGMNYDPAYRNLALVHADQNVTSYEYDPAGRIAEVTTPGGEKTTYLEYDGAGRPLAIKDSTGVVTRYEYNTPDGALSAVRFTETDGTTTNGPNSKNNATFTYDSYGRVVSKTDGSGTVQVTYATQGGWYARFLLCTTDHSVRRHRLRRHCNSTTPTTRMEADVA